jgi:hypothetical protein
MKNVVDSSGWLTYFYTDFDPIRYDERFRALVEGEKLG